MGGGASGWQTRFVDPKGTIVGEFRIERPIAWGGMAVIYLAENPVVGSKAAAKVLREELAVHPGIAERFLEEASAASKIRHPNTVQIYDFVSLSDGRPCILMEYLEGETLEKRAGKTPMPLWRARPILMQISAALGATHARGIVHRDLKAENVLLVVREGRDDFVKLLDFGLAKSTALAAGVSLPGTLAGTPFYMAPEQVRGEMVDFRTDIYSLGVLAYRLLVGHFPFEGQNVEEVMYKQVHQAPDLASLKPALAAVLARALAKMREGRYPSAMEFAQALAQVEPDREHAEQPPDWMQEPGLSPVAERQPTPPPAELAVQPAEPSPEPAAVKVKPPAVQVAAHAAQPMSPPGATPWPFLPTPVPKPAAVSSYVPVPTPWPLPAPTASLKPPAPEPEKAAPVAPVPPPKKTPAPRPLVEASKPEVEDKASRSDQKPEATKPTPAEPPAPASGTSTVAVPESWPAPPAIFHRREPMPGEPQPPLKILERYLSLSDRDHYAFLSVAEDAEPEVISVACAMVEQELVDARKRASVTQRSRFLALLARLGRARQTLDDLESRAAYDARMGNFRGVARSIAAGLSAGNLDKLRQEYAARFPERVARADEYFKTAQEHVKAGASDKALEALKLGLALDPLVGPMQRQFKELCPAKPAEGDETSTASDPHA